MSNITLRKATESDRTYIERLFYLAEVWGDEEKAVSDTYPETLDKYVHAWDEHQGGFIAVDETGIPAGGLWLRWGHHAPAPADDHLDEDDDVLELALAVEDRFRGKGVAKKLIAAAEERARSLGKHRLSLVVDHGNDVARGLYEKLGFELMVSKPERKIDVMQKILVDEA